MLWSTPSKRTTNQVKGLTSIYLETEWARANSASRIWNGTITNLIRTKRSQVSIWRAPPKISCSRILTVPKWMVELRWQSCRNVRWVITKAATTPDPKKASTRYSPCSWKIRVKCYRIIVPRMLRVRAAKSITTRTSSKVALYIWTISQRIGSRISCRII